MKKKMSNTMVLLVPIYWMQKHLSVKYIALGHRNMIEWLIGLSSFLKGVSCATRWSFELIQWLCEEMIIDRFNRFHKLIHAVS